MNSQDDTEKLLEQFSNEWPADSSIVGRVMQEIESAPVRKSLTSRLQRLTMMQRVAVGSLGLSAVVLLVVVAFAIGSPERASAMERMIEKLREVTSYQYVLNYKGTFTKEGAERPVTVEDSGPTYWLAPNSLRSEVRIIEYDANSPPDDRKTRLLEDIAEIYRPGKPGIVISHKARFYIWVPEFRGDLPDYSPMTKLRMVREKSGEVVRDLGSKNINGKKAQGFVMRLRGAAVGSGFDALEVWLDPETDLPIEFGYELKKKGRSEEYRITDCRWNIDLDPQLFEPIAPAGYTDTTPPKSDEALGQIIEALRLYAELSGGHYPRVPHFDGDAIEKEMQQMAGFMGEPKDEWTDNPKFQQVQQAKKGLDRLTRILLNWAHAGYRGQTVDSQQKDKVLLWWTVDAEKSYRVFYGDLRTELLKGDWGERLRNGEATR